MKTLLLSMAILYCFHFSPSSQFRFFQRDNSLDHFSCDPNDLVFVEEYGNVTCAAMCFLYTSNCTSIFWNPNYKTCYGCRNTYTTASGLPSDTGSRYFFKYSDWGEGCAFDSQCRGQNQQCVTVDDKSTCRCSPGYPYDPSTGECVTDCAVWGDTYQVYPFSDLQGGDISTKWGFQYIDWGQRCRAECTASADGCRSLDHTLAGWCSINSDTAATANLAFSLVHFHYQRNCA